MGALSNAAQGQERPLVLIQFEKPTTSSTKELLAFVEERTACANLTLHEGWVVRCECPTAIHLNEILNAEDKRSPRAIGVTILSSDGTMTMEGDAPFPVLLVTGDDAADDERYTTWKLHWIANYPARYASMLRDPLETTTGR
ncbi:MAG: hypothetical protein JNM62_08220 [Flavobacteriales bacterium]|nr:hypothetical protein [Flavobacteriales bacterium]